MLTNTALKLLAGKADSSGSWYKIECTAKPGGGADIVPGGSVFLCKAEPSTLSATKKTVNLTITGGSGALDCTWPSLSEGTYDSKSGCSATVSFPDEKKSTTINVPTSDSSDPPKTGTASCKINGLEQPIPGGTGLCSGVPRNGRDSCGNSDCNQYLPTINKYASGIATASMLKSLIWIESTCKKNAGSGAGACGLAQMLPPSAQLYARNCGITAETSCQWLKSHPHESICLAAAYLNATAAGICGNNIRHVLSGYNGHPDVVRGKKGTCQLSTSCTGPNCEGQPTRVWECPGAYAETKNYVQNNLYCMQHPGF